MFVTFEGPDGSGKSTVIRKLLEWLDSNNVDYIFTREPGGEGIKEAELIRNLILDNSSEFDDMAEALLFATSRRLNLEKVIWPAIKENKLVISDRYFDSSFAYQGVARGLGLDTIINLNEIATDKTYPDLTIYLKLPYEVARERVNSGGNHDRMESNSEDFIRKVHDGYDQVIEKFKDRFVIIDATKSKEEVFEQVKKVFKEKCLNK